MEDLTKTEAAKELVRACEDEFAYLGSVLTSLDSKAQNTASMAGLFIAAAFAFVDKLSLSSDRIYLYSSVLSVFLLLASVLFALISMWARDIKVRPTFEFVFGLITDLMKAPDESVQGEGFYGDLASEWGPSIEHMRLVLRRKGRYLSLAQWLLLASMGFIAVIIAVRIIGV